MPTTDPDQITTVEVVPGGPVVGQIRPPGSKSLTNRALICAAWAHGDGPSSGLSTLSGALQSEDTRVMIDALGQVGVGVEEQAGGTRLVVRGRDVGSMSWHEQTEPDTAQPDAQTATEIFIANSGTTIRFLTAALSAVGGVYRLSGVPRMHRRPIGDLIDAISGVIDGQIRAISPGGCPPVEILSRGWSGNRLEVAGSVSSQYLSGLMMAGPIAHAVAAGRGRDRTNDIQLRVQGELVSRPYVEMTAAVMREFGASVEISDDSSGTVPAVSVNIGPQPYRTTDYDIEPDASAASYFWAAAAITGGSVLVEGLTPSALQGDVKFCDVLKQMGCQVQSTSEGIRLTGGPLRGVDVDMNMISDTVQTLAVVALFAEGPTRVRGVAHNRFKETDRIGDLACELRKLGATVTEHDDGLTIQPPSQFPQQTLIETYHDHRMAMGFALAGLRVPGVKIANPSCTSKTYPNFFHDLEQLIGRPHQWSSQDTVAGGESSS